MLTGFSLLQLSGYYLKMKGLQMSESAIYQTDKHQDESRFDIFLKICTVRMGYSVFLLWSGDVCCRYGTGPWQLYIFFTSQMDASDCTRICSQY